MEIKHTVEILTKDIQEIEKLVRNLNNSPNPPKIELDLALSKLRNVYELLSMIREDSEQIPAPVQEHVREQADKKEFEQIEMPVSKAEPITVPEPETDITPEAKPGSVTEPEAIPEPKPEPKPEPVDVKPPVQTEIPLNEVQNEPRLIKKEAEILAEKFSNDPSINENIASVTKKANITSKIVGTPIDNIGRNIGINDRFLIIRELFAGDNDNYTQLIQQLDSSANEEEAIALLETSFPEATDHEGYLLLAQLAKRKFIRT